MGSMGPILGASFPVYGSVQGPTLPELDSSLGSTLPAVDSSWGSTLPAVSSGFGLSVGPEAGSVGGSGPAVSGCDVCGRMQRHMIDGNSYSTTCKRCLCDIFPFNHIANNREFRESLLTIPQPREGKENEI